MVLTSGFSVGTGVGGTMVSMMLVTASSKSAKRNLKGLLMSANDILVSLARCFAEILLVLTVRWLTAHVVFGIAVVLVWF